jgi:hypothetical protein
MKKDFTRRRFFVRAIIAFLAVMISLSAGAAYAQPLLVMQPAYAGMQFYIQQPRCIPANWFTTFDGYPVWRGADGVWFYGSFSNNTIIQTSYVVGSVVPTHVGISPYVIQTIPTPAPVIQRQMAMAPAPVVQRQVAAAPVVPMTQAMVAAPAPVVTALAVEYVPSWLSANFMNLGSWRRNVDRVGILAQPPIPVAWRGTWPKVLYAWTGSNWYQMIAEEGERPGDVLRRNLYVLTRLVHQSGNRRWCAPEDTAFLINRSAQWGYMWMGVIGPNPTRVH